MDKFQNSPYSGEIVQALKKKVKLDKIVNEMIFTIQAMSDIDLKSVEKGEISTKRFNDNLAARSGVLYSLLMGLGYLLGINQEVIKELKRMIFTIALAERKDIFERIDMLEKEGK